MARRAWLRHRYNFAPVTATAIRILVPGIAKNRNGSTASFTLGNSPPPSMLLISCRKTDALEQVGGEYVQPFCVEVEDREGKLLGGSLRVEGPRDRDK